MRFSAKPFQKVEKEKQYFFTTIPKGPSVEKPNKYVLIDVVEVLLEFKGTMVDEIPTRFLSTRSISHQIDLIPGLSLPNKEPHRVKPIENVELK